MELPFPVTLLVLLAFIVVGFIPKIPLLGRIGIQIVAGLAIYFGMKEAMFALPMPDTLPMSELYGGDGGMGEFNKYALGVIAPVLGIIFSLIAAVIFKLMSKKDA